MKKLLILLCVGLLCSCNKDITTTPSKISVPPMTKLRSAASGDGAYDLVGYGYDLTGAYANANSAKFQIIDVARFAHDYPTRVEIDNTTGTIGVLNGGNNAESYSSSLSAHLNVTVGLKLFKGDITTSYSNTDAFSSNYVYGGYDLRVQEKVVKINAPASLLRNYLTSSFYNDVQTQSWDYIISHYGTHILTNITLGGKLSVLYQSETTSNNKTTAASAGLSNGVVKVFNINTGFNYTSSDTQNNFYESLHYATYGGDPSKSLIPQTITISTNTPPVDIAAWQNSCTPANAQLIDIAQDGLMSLADLIPDPTQSAAAQNYINQYLASHQVTVTPAGSNTYPLPAQYNNRSFDYIGFEDPATYTKINISDAGPMLTVNQVISSPNGFYSLMLQSDGNLVLYRNGGGSPVGIWASNTSGQPSSQFFFQSDANLVIYNSSKSQHIWSSNIFDNNGTIFRYNSTGISTGNAPFLALQNDGNLALYWPAYTSDTHQLVCVVFGATDTTNGAHTPHSGSMTTMDPNMPNHIGSFFRTTSQ